MVNSQVIFGTIALLYRHIFMIPVRLLFSVVCYFGTIQLHLDHFSDVIIIHIFEDQLSEESYGLTVEIRDLLPINF